MKRNVKKALAFALAVVTVLGNLGVATPVSAAEYEEPKEVLEAKYEYYQTMFGDGVMFYNLAEVEVDEDTTDYYVEELVLVNGKGEVSNVPVKDADGKCKYNNVSPTADNGVALITFHTEEVPAIIEGEPAPYFDYVTYEIYYEDGTVFGNGEEQYRNITRLDDGNYLVVKKDGIDVVDPKGTVIAEDLFVTSEKHFTATTRVAGDFGDYMLIEVSFSYPYGGHEDVYKVFDKNYKPVDENEYHSYMDFEDGMYVHQNDSDTYMLESMIILEDDGKLTTINTKNEDGSYKYVGVSEIFDYTSLASSAYKNTFALVEMHKELVTEATEETEAVYQHYYTYELYLGDGIWIGNGEEKYTNIFKLVGGNFIVANDTTFDLVNAKGEVLTENIMTPVVADEIRVFAYELGEYTVLTRNVVTGDEGRTEHLIYDANGKAVDSIDLSDKGVMVAHDSLFVYTSNGFKIYDNTLKLSDKKIDISSHVNNGATINYIGSSFDYIGYRPMLTFGLDYLETNEFDTIYLDWATGEELSVDDVYPYGWEYEVNGLDYTYASINSIFYFYKDGKVAFTTEEILETLKEKYATDQMYANYALSVDDDIFIAYYYYNEEVGYQDTLVILTAESNYSIADATIHDLSVLYAPIWDGVERAHCYSQKDDVYYTYFQGKWYEGDNVVQTYFADGYEGYKVFAYSVREGEKEPYTYGIYAPDGTKLLSLDKQICDFTADGLIVYANVEKDPENEELEIYKFGCLYAGKKLVSNEDILDEIVSVEEGGKVEVTLEKNEPIASEVLGAIKGQDVNVVVTTPSGITWTINGKDVTGTDLKNIDLTVEIVKDVVPADAIAAVKVEGEKIELSLAHTGDFGFKAEMKLNVEVKNADKYANLFYYNPTTKELEFQGAAKIDKDGYAAFTYTHASDYVIMITDQAYVEPTEPEPAPEPTLPDEGDFSNAAVYMVVLLGAALVTAGVVEKKRMNAR